MIGQSPLEIMIMVITETFEGAWWYSACHASNLNGWYRRGNQSSYADGVNWKGWKDYRYPLKRRDENKTGGFLNCHIYVTIVIKYLLSKN